MADTTWLLEILKLAAAGGVGLSWERFHNRSKRREMRRHLYQELADNYGTLTEALSEEKRPNLVLRDALPYRLEFRYFDYALTQMNTFHSLPDYVQIADVYDRCREIELALRTGNNLVYLVERTKLGIEEAAAEGLLNKKLLLKQARPWIRDLLKPRIEQRAEDLKSIPPVP